MKKGITTSGFEFEIDENVLDDYELLELFVEADNGDNMAIFKAIDFILNKEQKTALKEHLRKIHGKVPASAMVKEVMDMMEGTDTGKNS